MGGRLWPSSSLYSSVFIFMVWKGWGSEKVVRRRRRSSRSRYDEADRPLDRLDATTTGLIGVQGHVEWISSVSAEYLRSAHVSFAPRTLDTSPKSSEKGCGRRVYTAHKQQPRRVDSSFNIATSTGGSSISDTIIRRGVDTISATTPEARGAGHDR